MKTFVWLMVSMFLLIIVGVFLITNYMPNPEHPSQLPTTSSTCTNFVELDCGAGKVEHWSGIDWLAK